MVSDPPKLVFGTMRLSEIERSIEGWVQFFIALHELDVRKIHSSSEYQSFPLFCEILKRIRQIKPEIKFEHVVKLAEPSFDEAGFEASRFEQKINNYLELLGTDRVADVQWMWRANLDNEGRRIDNFKAASNKIANGAEKLKNAGRMERILCFPYSVPFAFLAANNPTFDGLTVYRNESEREYDDAIDKAHERGQITLIIRPFFGGKLLYNDQISSKTLFRRAVGKAGVEAGIVSSSNLDHIRQLIY